MSSHFKQISAICLLSFIYFPVKIKKVISSVSKITSKCFSIWFQGCYRSTFIFIFCFSTSVYLVCNHQEKFVLCACWLNQQRALCSKSYFRFRKKKIYFIEKSNNISTTKTNFWTSFYSKTIISIFRYCRQYKMFPRETAIERRNENYFRHTFYCYCVVE